MREELLNKALATYQTPLYLFDETDVVRSAKRIRDALPHGVSLCYAMKANPFVLRGIASEVERIEVCSMGEMRICQASGISMGSVVVSGVHKDPLLMQELMEGGAFVGRYTVESVLQYDMLEHIASGLGMRIPILVRLTSGNQFGLDEQTVRMLMRRAQESPSLYACGIQYFSGTQKTSERRMRRELAYLDGLLNELGQELTRPLEELEYGAGLPVEYFDKDAQEDGGIEDSQLDVLGDALKKMSFGGKVFVELGRSLVASCGAYATTVVDAKKNDGYRYAIVDGGMHQIAYYGSAMSLQQPPCRFLPDRTDEGEDLWSICGSLCTSNDMLAKLVPCGDVQVGDVVVFEKAGAYCMTEGRSLFLSRDLPRIVLADLSGELVQVRDRIETHSLNGSGRKDK